MRYFLVETYGETTKVREFADRDYRKALDAYQARESELFPFLWDQPRVCLFRTDSLETLRQTHGSWFGTKVTVA